MQRKHPEHAPRTFTKPYSQKRHYGLFPRLMDAEEHGMEVIDTSDLCQSTSEQKGPATEDILIATGSIPSATRNDSCRVGTFPATSSPPQDKPIAIDQLLNVTPDDLHHLLAAEPCLGQTDADMELHFPSFDADMAGFNFISTIMDKNSSNSPPRSLDDGWTPTTAQTTRGCELFFTHVAHYAPFIHYPTFSQSEAPQYLLLSMMCLGYQYGEDPDCGYQADSGATLSRRCFRHARAYVAAVEDEEEEAMCQLPLVKSYLLLQICAMMFLCGKHSFYGLRAHSKMICLARSGRLMRAVLDNSRGAGDLETLWQDFVKAESLKRTIFAMHQIDALWYQVLSVPRQLSHLEVKHELPCTEDLWNASSAAEWAHRRLVSGQSGPLIDYPKAIRQLLSPGFNPVSFPAFDPYGAINITQFLISSAREISGWSTMTGQVSLERFEPLKGSLPALGHFICQQHDSSGLGYVSLPEMTWHIAMIEMEVWSPSHVGGIVEESVDSLLKQSSYLSLHIELLCEPSIASAIKPHVDWFLRYLDATVTPNLEAPWVTLYAFKAFLIAWQFMCGQTPASMEIVGVSDGDKEGALRWAKKVFQRRQRWQLGRLVLERLESLSNEHLNLHKPKSPNVDWPHG
ncbi:hypothetical protein NPX13_g76 [Xylaria arbuscula]|uniref:Xylanolytic transcriptional activator regulatory domain-containing protein n=1 Tax=Xylaria arbuscula TaxID=114810 RepID=A0A9W8TS59_9PEZI|nr:hypothetical protein NPX13_g76 [Xylaria arbuscula]